MKFVNMDITTVTGRAVIIHGVNCQRKMGSGVAKALYARWPQIKEEYLSHSRADMHLGKISSVQVSETLYVINCWTQDKYGFDGAAYASADAIEEALRHALEFCIRKGVYKLYSPKIGSGLGGLDWKTQVLPIFEKAEGEFPDVEIIICDYLQEEKSDEN